MKKTRLIITVLILMSCLLPAGARAQQELGNTLQEIKDTGVILMGYRGDTAIPFCYPDGKGQPIGYAMEYAWKIVDAIKERLNMPELKVQLVPITTQNRIFLLTKGAYHFECGSTTNNKERQRQVGFSNTIFVCDTRFLVEKSSGIKDYSDLQDKNVIVTAGTTSEGRLHDLNDSEQLGMRIISTKNYSDALKTVDSGRAAAFLLDDILLAGEIAVSGNPGNWEIVGTPLSHEAYGCMIRRRDNQFKSLVDEVIAQTQLSGQAEKWFIRWFQQAIPPNGINLNFELSDSMKELFQHPNDTPFQ